jgi:aminomethyltransferase
LDAELLRTPLYERHVGMGARMVPFSGWLMPIQYEGVVAEHLHTRSAAGLFDLSHMGRLTFHGADAERLIQVATTNDASKLEVGGAQYSLVCNEQGGVIEDLLVYRFPDAWRMIVNASNRLRVVGLLEDLARQEGLDAQVQDETEGVALLAVQGPLSVDVLQPHVSGDLSDLAYYHAQWDTLRGLDGARVIVSRTGYTGEDGFEVAVPASVATTLWDDLLADQRVKPIGLGARDTLRLEAGMALYGHELTEDVNPFEARLGRVVRLDKGPFQGREALERLKNAEPVRRLVGLAFESGAVPRATFPVLHHGERVGEVASGTFSPTLRQPIATAYVRSDCSAPGTHLEVEIRGAPVPASVVPLPLVKKSKP